MASPNHHHHLKPIIHTLTHLVIHTTALLPPLRSTPPFTPSATAASTLAAHAVAVASSLELTHAALLRAGDDALSNPRIRAVLDEALRGWGVCLGAVNEEIGGETDGGVKRGKGGRRRWRSVSKRGGEGLGGCVEAVEGVRGLVEKVVQVMVCDGEDGERALGEAEALVERVRRATKALRGVYPGIGEGVVAEEEVEDWAWDFDEVVVRSSAYRNAREAVRRKEPVGDGAAQVGEQGQPREEPEAAEELDEAGAGEDESAPPVGHALDPQQDDAVEEEALPALPPRLAPGKAPAEASDEQREEEEEGKEKEEEKEGPADDKEDDKAEETAEEKVEEKANEETDEKAGQKGKQKAEETEEVNKEEAEKVIPKEDEEATNDDEEDEEHAPPLPPRRRHSSPQTPPEFPPTNSTTDETTNGVETSTQDALSAAPPPPDTPSPTTHLFQTLLLTELLHTRTLLSLHTHLSSPALSPTIAARHLTPLLPLLSALLTAHIRHLLLPLRHQLRSIPHPSLLVPVFRSWVRAAARPYQGWCQRVPWAGRVVPDSRWGAEGARVGVYCGFLARVEGGGQVVEECRGLVGRLRAVGEGLVARGEEVEGLREMEGRIESVNFHHVEGLGLMEGGRRVVREGGLAFRAKGKGGWGQVHCVRLDHCFFWGHVEKPREAWFGKYKYGEKLWVLEAPMATGQIRCETKGTRTKASIIDHVPRGIELFPFTVTSGEITHLFAAATEEERQEWMGVLGDSA